MEHVLGSISMRRVGVFAFPVWAVVQDDGTSEGKVLARLGRDGWFRVFFGRGRRVEPADGMPWRVSGVGVAGCIAPIVTCEAGKLAIAAPYGTRSYGINGRDFAYVLYPISRVGFGKKTWSLREHEDEVARFDSVTMFAHHPVPLAAALLCFTLTKYGVLGEATLSAPAFRW